MLSVFLLSVLFQRCITAVAMGAGWTRCWAQSCQNALQVIRAQTWVESVSSGACALAHLLKGVVILLGRELMVWACQSLAQWGGDKSGHGSARALINCTVRVTDSKEKSQPVTVGVSLGWLDLIMLVQEEDLGLLKTGCENWEGAINT